MSKLDETLPLVSPREVGLLIEKNLGAFLNGADLNEQIRGMIKLAIDAQRAQDVRGVVTWLRTDSSLWDLNGLKIAAELESMLERGAAPWVKL